MFDWPWSSVRHYKCPQGIRAVHKDVSKAFPLFLSDWNTSVQAATAAVQSIDASASVEVSRTIQDVLMKVDEKNASAQAQFRAAYMVFASAPCEMLEYLQGEIAKIREHDAQLRLIEGRANEIAILAKAGAGLIGATEKTALDFLKPLLNSIVEQKIVSQMQSIPDLVEWWKA